MKSLLKDVRRSAMGSFLFIKSHYISQKQLNFIILIYSPYDNRWSKTMIGYGPESSHFVMELTYNYGVTSYDLGMYVWINLGTWRDIANSFVRPQFSIIKMIVSQVRSDM